MQNIIEDLKNYLIEKYNCHSIILYGSFADGTQTDESDIDIICFTDTTQYKNDTNGFQGRKLDVWIYNSEMMEKSEELTHIHGGKILLDKRNLCNDLLNNISKIITDGQSLSIEEVQFQKDWLLKMLNRARKNDIEGNFRYHWLLVDSLEIYFIVKGIRYLGPKKSLLYLKNNDAIAYKYFSNALKINSEFEEVEKLVKFILNS